MGGKFVKLVRFCDGTSYGLHLRCCVIFITIASTERGGLQHDRKKRRSHETKPQEWKLNNNTTMTIEINLKLNWIKIYCYNYYYNPPSPPSLLTETTSSYSSRMSRITWLSVSTTTHNVLMVSVVSCSREHWRVRHICHRRRGRRRRHVIIARIFKDGVHHHRTTPKGQ